MTPRVIPVLLLRGAGLVKTVRFRDPVYVGDPRNAVRIFNEKEVDELAILDIEASLTSQGPSFGLLEEIVSEAFMPVAYGGGLRTVEQAARVLEIGVEKVIFGTQAVETPELVRQAAQRFGSQSVVVCLDVRKGAFGGYSLRTRGGRRQAGRHVVETAREMVGLGAGELLIHSIDRDGTMAGYDLPLVRSVSQAVQAPVIACGGAGSLKDFRTVVTEAGASAAAAGSIFVFHGRHRAVLISYPPQAELEALFCEGMVMSA